MQTTKIPATIVTGFLGSGKTTLMRHILEQANGLRVAVIVNEFGELGIDGEILKTCAIGCQDEGGADTAAGQIYELANGCMCCTVQEEFFPVMQALAERRADIDVLLIETSGLALPKPLVQAFQWPDIASVFTVDSVVTVVDAPATAAGQFAHDPHAVDAQRQADPIWTTTPACTSCLKTSSRLPIWWCCPRPIWSRPSNWARCAPWWLRKCPPASR